KYIAPRSKLEQRITEIWEEVLEKKEIGVKDNYFELGGDSLKGIRVVNQLQTYLKVIVHISLLFDAVTIEELAAELEKYTLEYADKVDEYNIEKMNGTKEPLPSYPLHKKKNNTTILPIEELEYYDVSYAQKRLWIIDLFEKGKLTYNQPRVYEL